MGVTIYCVYHKKAHLISGSAVRAIQVGNGNDIAPDILRDNVLTNINKKNESYCELTAHYWAWRNDSTSDYIGLMHYRRLLSFAPKTSFRRNRWGFCVVPAFTDALLSQLNLSDKEVSQYCLGVDMVLPNPWDVKRSGYSSLREHYRFGDGQHVADLDAARAILLASYPDFVSHYDRVIGGSVASFNNMFVMRRAVFEDYSTWIFDVLERLEAIIPWRSYAPVDRRVFGYLSERLLNVWVSWYQSAHPETIIRYADPVFVDDPSEEAFAVYANPRTVGRQFAAAVVLRSVKNRFRRLLQRVYVHIPVGIRLRVRPYAVNVLRALL